MKKQIFLAIFFFILGATSMFLIKQREPVNDPEVTVKLLKSCVNAIDALNVQGETCLQAYSEFRTCVTDVKTCDIQQSAIKLKELEDLRKKAQDAMIKENANLLNISKILGIK